jgi:hypothetical protein
MASLYDLQTIYSLEDAYDLLEILNVRRANEKLQTPEADT